MVLQIKRNTAGSSSSQGFIRWVKCDKPGKPCSPFVLEGSTKALSTRDRGTSTPDDGSAPKLPEKLGIIVTFKDQQLCSAKDIPKSRTSDPDANKIRSTMKVLQEHAERTQKGVLDLLETKTRSKAFAYDSIDKLWIINAISISGASLSDVQAALEGHSDVLSVREEEILTVAGGPSGALGQTRVVTDYDSIINQHWGVQEIGAPEVWAQGYNGSGIAIGQIDTGVAVAHESLVDNFRKEYGWFDPHGHAENPWIGGSHGTHVIGTAVGRKGIGVAPGAQFITCGGCVFGCHERHLIACAQWLYCPTDTNGTNPDCSKRPHIINMSVAGPQESRNEAYVVNFGAAVDCWRSAGIIPIIAMGNDGPGCGSAGFPGVLNTVIGVGNLERLVESGGTKIRTKRGERTHSPCKKHPTHAPTPTPQPKPQGSLRCYNESSRGPPLARFNGTTKPDISAPGTNIASAVHQRNHVDRYDLYTGTSMAAPHVAGIVALMLQKDPSLTFDQIKEILISTAIQPADVSEANSQCGDIAETLFPNNCMGYGAVHAVKAMERVTKKN